MSTVVMTMGSLQQHRPPVKKMVMMLSPPHDMQQAQIVQPSNGACVIVSANGYPPHSPPHFTNLDSCAPTSTTTVTTTASNNNSLKAKNNNNNTNNNLNKVSRVGGGAVQKVARTSVVVNNTTTSSAAAEALRCKRRIQFNQGASAGQGHAPGHAPGSLSFTGHQPASVARRNARERNRVKQVNNGFATLRSHIPPAIAAALQESSGGSSSSSERSSSRSAKEKEAAKKLSKVETLRMAVEYIRSLQALLSESSANENAAPVSVKTESVLSDSPNGFDADYEAALALSHYSMGQESGMSVGHGVGGHGGVHGMVPGMSMSPPCSDASSSPTPSYVSDGSVGASSTGYAPPPFVTRAAPQSLQCRHPATPPDSSMYEPMSPEDEELLDVISWWQQSN